MNYRKIPVPEPDKNDLEYVCPPASWGDMTGLIPTAPESRSDLNSYEELYPFLPHPEAYIKD